MIKSIKDVQIINIKSIEDKQVQSSISVSEFVKSAEVITRHNEEIQGQNCLD